MLTSKALAVFRGASSIIYFDDNATVVTAFKRYTVQMTITREVVAMQII